MDEDVQQKKQMIQVNPPGTSRKKERAAERQRGAGRSKARASHARETAAAALVVALVLAASPCRQFTSAGAGHHILVVVVIVVAVVVAVVVVVACAMSGGEDTGMMMASMEEEGAVGISVGAGKEQIVTPWEVEAGDDGVIDYDKIVKTWGAEYIDEDLIRRIEQSSGKKAHRFLRRKLFFVHKDLEKVLDTYDVRKYTHGNHTTLATLNFAGRPKRKSF